MIRRAKLEDAKTIHEIAESLRLNKEDPQKDGFLVYVLSEQGYRDRIKSSKYVYVSETDEGINGFLVCIPNANADELESGLEGKLEKPYIFGEHIGINPGEKDRGIGTGLLDALFQDMRSNSVYTMYVEVLHEPVLNQCSVDFCDQIGYQRVGEITKEDGFVWGIYKLSLTQ